MSQARDEIPNKRPISACLGYHWCARIAGSALLSISPAKQHAVLADECTWRFHAVQARVRPGCEGGGPLVVLCGLRRDSWEGSKVADKWRAVTSQLHAGCTQTAASMTMCGEPATGTV